MSLYFARHCRALVALMLCCVIAAAGAEPVTVERDSVLRSEPRTEATELSDLPNKSTGEAVTRQGAWVQIKSGTVSGWLYSFNLRFTTAASADSSGSVLGRVFGPRQRISVTSTIGIRGLDEEDLKQARFDGGQMQQLDGFAATREQAQAYAGEAGLNAGRIEYLTESAGGEPARRAE